MLFQNLSSGIQRVKCARGVSSPHRQTFPPLKVGSMGLFDEPFPDNPNAVMPAFRPGGKAGSLNLAHGKHGRTIASAVKPRGPLADTRTLAERVFDREFRRWQKHQDNDKEMQVARITLQNERILAAKARASQDRYKVGPPRLAR